MSSRSREGWTVHRFDEIARSITERVDDPALAGVDRYVGLEHLDPDSLRIRRWGSPSDVSATKLRFAAGDVIFGRRRAYQRKVAIAEFDGICSAHALVLRAKPGAIVPEFLPFFMQSDTFMSRAIEISVGGLSPTINWPALAAQEFMLPPIEEQRRISLLLTELDRLLTHFEEIKRSARTIRRSLTAASARSAREAIPLSEVATSITSGSRGWASYYSPAGSLFVRITNLQRDDVRLDWSNKQHVTPPDSMETTRTRIVKGDVLISITAELGLVAICEELPAEPAYINQHLAKVRVDPSRVDPFLLAHWLTVPPVSAQFGALNDHGAKAGMNLVNVGALRIPKLPIESQQAVVAGLRAVQRAYDGAADSQQRLLLIRTRALNSVGER